MIERRAGRSLAGSSAPRPRTAIAEPTGTHVRSTLGGLKALSGLKAPFELKALSGLKALLGLLALPGLLAVSFGSSPSPARAGEAGGAVAQVELGFAKHGEAVTTRTLADLRAAVPKEMVRVYEPYESGEAEFVALPFAMVLDLVYGEAWREEEELLFTCSDGYQPTVPVKRVLEHRAWLAFDRSDEPGFTIHKRESGEVKRIELAPFYLIWENLDDEKVRSEGDYGWPYQLVGVDLIRTRDRFARMLPPAGAPQSVRDGFAAFRVHCSRCHTINGQGGSIGPELNGAVPSVASRERDWIARRIDDPSRVMEKARMPRLDPQLPQRERVIGDLIAYLEAMARAKNPHELETAGGR
jgi:mono/diheme cytochrome c family protein